MRTKRFASVGAVILAAIVLIMVSGSGRAQVPPKGTATEGLRLYLGNCLICHGVKADGNGPYAKKLDPKPRPFTDREYFDKKSDMEIYDIISKGGAVRGKSPHMRTWGLRFAPRQISDLVAYVRAISKNTPIEMGTPLKPVTGKKLFIDYCSNCHGKKGKGDGPLAFTLPTKPISLASREFQKLATDQRIFDSVKKGVAVSEGKPMVMPPWNKLLSDNQINMVVEYVRGLAKE